MADVYVTSWQEFLQAILVSGDTVHCPENAIWDMNDIEPEGHSGTLRFECDNVYGNGTTIKNMMHSGSIQFQQDFQAAESLNWENLVISYGSFFVRDGSETYSKESCSKFRMCKISGITSGTDYSLDFAKNFVFHRCSFNVEASTSTRFYIPLGMEYCNFIANWPSARAIAQASNAVPGASSPYFSSLIITAPSVTWDSTSNNATACIFKGRKDRAEGISNANTQYPSLYSLDDYPAMAQPGTSMIGVTEAQLKDAAYLSSIGFPIGVD